MQLFFIILLVCLNFIVYYLQLHLVNQIFPACDIPALVQKEKEPDFFVRLLCPLFKTSLFFLPHITYRSGRSYPIEIKHSIQHFIMFCKVYLIFSYLFPQEHFRMQVLLHQQQRLPTKFRQFP